MCSLGYAARPLMVDAAIAAGLGKHAQMSNRSSPCNRAAFFFEDPEEAGDILREFVQPGDAILFKGSRGTHVERALENGCSITNALLVALRSSFVGTFTPFRVFRYVTFRVALRQPYRAVPVRRAWALADRQAARVSDSASTSAKTGRSRTEEGRNAHHGRLLIIISIVVPTLLWADLRNPYVWIALLGLVGFGAIGFMDDYARSPRSATWV